MKAHLFYYKWPRIREGLIHKEFTIPASWSLVNIPVSSGAFLLREGSWHRGSSFAIWSLIDTDKVPNEIRATALILNL